MIHELKLLQTDRQTDRHICMESHIIAPMHFVNAHSKMQIEYAERKYSLIVQRKKFNIFSTNPFSHCAIVSWGLIMRLGFLSTYHENRTPTNCLKSPPPHLPPPKYKSETFDGQEQIFIFQLHYHSPQIIIPQKPIISGNEFVKCVPSL